MKFSALMNLAGTLLVYFHASGAVADDVVTIYPAITNGNDVFVEGRVIEHKDSSAPAADDGMTDNLSRNLALMVNDERKHYPVTVRFGLREWQTMTDQEGYFRVELNALQDLAAGWYAVSAQTAHGQGEGKLLKVAAANTQGIISDIDDTIQVTQVNSKRRMLANTFFLNSMQREVVPGIAMFYRQLSQANPQPESAPTIYLSASPRQLHGNIDGFLIHNNFPPGVLITKRVTDDATSEPITDQVAYKTKKIETILLSLPTVRFTLIGDDGEHDPEIYADVAKRFPERIASIWIRKVNPNKQRATIGGQGNLDDALAKFR